MGLLGPKIGSGKTKTSKGPGDNQVFQRRNTACGHLHFVLDIKSVFGSSELDAPTKFPPEDLPKPRC